MSDRDGTMNTESDRSLAAALRALPDATPAPDLWPELARALTRKQASRRWRYAVPAALAAGVALALLMPRMQMDQPAMPLPSIATTHMPTPATTTSVATRPAPDDSELDNLHNRSQSLERWIAAVAANAPQDSRDLMAAVEVEDLIGLVDVQLGAPHGDDEALPLWRKRVALLEDLATIRGNGFAVAANDDRGARTAPQLLN